MATRGFRIGTATDIGRKRSQNQDSLISVPELGLFIVADGMGGHRGGETASAMAVDIIPKAFRRLQQAQSGLKPEQTLIQAMVEANNAIFERSQHEPQLQGMGTTSVALLFGENRLAIGHVGDSRAYFFRDNALWQLTRDHSLVQEKLRAGLITRDELKTDRMKNVITRSVGFEPDVNVEVYTMEVRPGDSFLICSDGLSGMIDDPVIRDILVKHSSDPQKAVHELISAANSNGGDDNISTVLVEITGS